VDLKQIKELMKSMQGTSTKKLELSMQNGFKLVLEQQEGPCSYRQPVQENDFFKQELAAHRADPMFSRPMALAASTPSEIAAPATPAEELDLSSSKYISSPMVGTFYYASSPESAAFVKVGDKVEKDTIVCIIEAMKVMNEIKSGISGTVVEILVENGHPVEFGTKLYRIT
jgi:acetyl-CoA carboxylase biotin carboxyl carrier protein